MFKEAKILRKEINDLQMKLGYEFRMDMFEAYGACVNIVQVRMSQGKFTKCLLTQLEKLPFDRKVLDWAESLVVKPLHFRKRHCRVNKALELLNVIAIREDLQSLQAIADYINVAVHRVKIFNGRRFTLSDTDLASIKAVLLEEEMGLYNEVVKERDQLREVRQLRRVERKRLCQML